MNTSNENFPLQRLTLAVQGALVALSVVPLAAIADDDFEVVNLTRPTNSIEIGVESVSQDSAKFGEYNGLNKSGVAPIGNFSVRGGDAYDSFDGGTGVTRWEATGSDLGTTSRELGGTVSKQGQWNLGIKYDELRHQITDSYQTPFQGAQGGNSFTLPATFGVIDTATGTLALDPNQQLSSFRREDVHSDRKNTSLNAGYIFDRQWSFQFDYNRLQQTGAKLISASSDFSGGGAGENTVTLMTPTNYTTDTFDTALNWVGDKGHLSGSYFASIFKDGYSSLSWSNPFDGSGLGTGAPPPLGAFPVNVFATAPNNTFHQLNLTGGYDFTEATKIAGGLSYGRNTQNSSFIDDPLLGAALPQGSLNGLVVSTHADLKLTNQASKDLMLSAGFKYNERDNRTPSNTYAFNSIAGDPYTAVNAPVSNKKTQIEFAGNYRIDKQQSVRLAYEYEAIKRWCNNSLANSAQSTDINFPAGYYTNSACVQSPESKENRLAANYNLKLNNTVKFTAGYTYADRRADINSSYYNPMQANANGLQNLGFVPYFDASRKEQLVKAGVNWQANSSLNLGLSGRYVDDKYDTTLGVQNGHTWGLNLDAAYTYAEDSTVSAYLSWQSRRRDLLSSDAQSPLVAPTPSTLWNNRLTDDTTTIGISTKNKSLMGGRLAVEGDLSYSLGKTGYSTQYQDASVCTDLTCGKLPDIKNDILRLKITGTYQLDRSSKIALGYRFQKLKSNDYYYSAYQAGLTDTVVLPTNQQAPSYSVNLFMASYIYNFQ